MIMIYPLDKQDTCEKSTKMVLEDKMERSYLQSVTQDILELSAPHAQLEHTKWTSHMENAIRAKINRSCHTTGKRQRIHPSVPTNATHILKKSRTIPTAWKKLNLMCKDSAARGTSSSSFYGS